MEDYHQSSSLPATDWFVHCIDEDSRINKRNANQTGNAHRVATIGPPAGKMACQDFSPNSTNHFPNSEILAEKLEEEEEEGEEEETSPPVAKRSKRKQSEQSEESAALGAFNRLKSASKPHSTPLTLKWLEENYEIAPGVCIPRSTLYYHYLDFCEKHDTQPVNAASFGKIIRQQFQHITTRRLGTRGQSKYNYYGIGIRETSIYYDIMYSAKGVQNANGGKKDNVKQIIAYSPRSKLGTLLPDFPDLKDIKFPAEIGEDKAMTFMMMYRTHCQRILDTVIRANFDEVQSFLLHFWQGMPQHIVPILGHDVIVLLVGVCDSILYKAIASVLMPTVLQALPDSLTQVIRRFAKQLDEWLKQALESLPEGLQKLKFDLARRFSQVLRRQTSLNHLCQAARSVTQSPEMTSQMLDDWISVDTGCIVKQTLYTMDKYTEKEHGMIVKLCREFEKLLEEQAALECFIEWLDSMVERCVVQPSKRNPKCLRKSARQFLLMWSCFGTRIIRDMTLHSAPSFGSFHLLHLMFDEYVLYLVESLYSQERASDFLRVVKGEETESTEEDVLPDSSVIRNNLSLGTSISPLESHAREKEKNRCSVIQNQGLNDERFCNQSYFPSYSMVGFQSQTQKSPVQSMFSTIRQEGCSPQHFGQCVFPNFSQTCISSGNTCDDLSNYGMNTQLQISLPMSQGYISSSDSNRVNHISDWTNQLSNISYVDSNRSCEMSSKNSNGSCTVIDGLGYNSVTTSDDLYRNSPIALKPVDGSKHHVNTDEVSNRVPQINNDIPLQQSSLNNNHI